MTRASKLRWPLVFTSDGKHDVCHPFKGHYRLSETIVLDFRVTNSHHEPYKNMLCVFPGYGYTATLVTPSMLEVRCYLEGLLNE